MIMMKFWKKLLHDFIGLVILFLLMVSSFQGGYDLAQHVTHHYLDQQERGIVTNHHQSVSRLGLVKVLYF